MHIVLGPNEAGNSTTLQAMGDFLFGIPGQTPQGWRWGYGDLRILEDEGRRIEVIRRKGNKDTLLRPDGTAMSIDPVAPLMQGLDRTAFERMFGPDHARLRAEGDAILQGRDDAARITLEAGTGVTGIRRELDRFADVAAELFKPSASKPLLNRLMTERGEALRLVRETAISDRDWTEEKRRPAEAEGRRAALLMEADELSREESRVNRIGRARAPLARLLSARGRLTELGGVSDISAESPNRPETARSERRTAAELVVRLKRELARIGEEVGSIDVAGGLLALRPRIEQLDELRPVIEKVAGDLARRVARREEMETRLAVARGEAGLPTNAVFPGTSWRRRAAAHLLERRDAAASRKAAKRRRDDLAARCQELARERGALPTPDTALGIEVALRALPSVVSRKALAGSLELGDADRTIRRGR